MGTGGKGSTCVVADKIYVQLKFHNDINYYELNLKKKKKKRNFKMAEDN